ncbi:MAG: alanine dehydrogenase [Nitrospinota bacterium]|nr:alanine dehydrogenase [Nitrospinota bacterium]
MIIGAPREVKEDEYRVAMVPAGVRQLTLAGHELLVQTGAGKGSGIPDSEYESEGARIVETAEEAWSAQMVVKVKEPVETEYKYFREDLLLYTFLHLAAAPILARKLMETGVIAIGYETVQEPDGLLPILAPMSEVAGRMAVQAGAKYLEKEHGGRGILLGGVPGVSPGKVAILGAGVVGSNAARIAVGLGARTMVLDTDLRKLRRMEEIYGGRVETLISNPHNILAAVSEADLLIGAVLVAGAKAPWLVTRDMLKEMKSESVIVDVSVDQGGCVETSRPTSHSAPTFVVDSVTHYCVSNMPGAVPRTSTFALASATFPGIFQFAEKGIDKTIQENYDIRHGVNVADGNIAHPRVSGSLGLPCKFPEKWN